eukprot:COSAG06_NODE_1376_length_9648_cov_67.818096_12_plen_234_part_00
MRARELRHPGPSGAAAFATLRRCSAPAGPLNSASSKIGQGQPAPPHKLPGCRRPRAVVTVQRRQPVRTRSQPPSSHRTALTLHLSQPAHTQPAQPLSQADCSPSARRTHCSRWQCPALPSARLSPPCTPPATPRTASTTSTPSPSPPRPSTSSRTQRPSPPRPCARPWPLPLSATSRRWRTRRPPSWRCASRRCCGRRPPSSSPQVRVCARVFTLCCCCYRSGTLVFYHTVWL